MPAPTLDGSNTGIATAASTIATTLTTTGTNRIACVIVYAEHNTNNMFLTGVSGGGLAWQKRTQVTTFAFGGIGAQSLELWWAVAPSALAAVTITATFNTTTYDNAAMLVFGVAGCNTTTPWDANPTLAARLYGFSSQTPVFNNISTTQANDFLVFAWGCNNNQAIGTVPAGFTAINSRVNSGGSLFASIAAASRGVTATQASQSFQWGNTIAGNNAAIFDSLTADTSGIATAPIPTWETIGKGSASATNTVGVTIAGPSANDVIVVLSYCEQSGGGPAITGISGGGLTWTRRSRSHGSARGNLEIWSAPVTGTLALNTATISYAANFDGLSVIALAVVGCDSSIWDANAGVPKLASNTVGGTWTPSVSSVTTTQAHDGMLAVVGGAGSTGQYQLPPTGFSSLAQVTTTTGSLSAILGIGLQQRTTTQSGATVTWGSALNDGTSTNASGEYVVDALTADTAVVASTQGARAMVLA